MTPEELIDQCGDFSDSEKRALALAIREAVDAARAEERERCAKVADAFAVHQYADPKLVAAAIRKGPTR